MFQCIPGCSAQKPARAAASSGLLLAETPAADGSPEIQEFSSETEDSSTVADSGLGDADEGVDDDDVDDEDVDDEDVEDEDVNDGDADDGDGADDGGHGERWRLQLPFSWKVQQLYICNVGC